ncbi:YjbE family putative metal transport protein [Pusillimonas sp. TS35]|uniref:TerC family protein n=1 Tax=Paracandidimonas lactea TaxID=2895524 RepID=UPI00136DA250|nr:TerC family protein [Paracandidimonas lactea]MYN11969.1 YjbE family putative metal transport protein [Pusillimonas sp. TS35]
MDVGSTQFWLALLEIIWVNILLSGDNAVVIALAARSLPPNQQRMAIGFGSTGAIVLRIILTIVAAKLLLLPWLKVVGGLLLLCIGISLLRPSDDAEDGVREHGSLMAAIRTILLADLVMSLDNVVAVAAAAHGDFVLLIFGLAISIPLVIFGSTLLLKVIERLPVIVWLGAALLGYIAGEMLVSDPAMVNTIDGAAQQLHTSVHQFAVFIGVAGAVIVLATGKVLRLRAAG